ncbi:MAG: ACT domain-containing protein [Sedimentisphaerales bacterium]|nr:ACT domain-containing protein [Sedimentisphaerales bacterium]
MDQYILSITAQDRPGIVAGISSALFGLKGNIEAASQTVHQGYFAMIVLCRLPGEESPETIAQRVRQRAGDDLHVYVTPYRPLPVEPQPAGQTFIVTAIGPDQPGILYALSDYLAAKMINIDDLYCCVQGRDFVVICQVTVPPERDFSLVQMDLEAVGRKRGFEVHLQHENIFTATNELRFGRLR